MTFFGVGAYGVSLPLYSVGTNWSALVIEFIAAAARALAIGLFCSGCSRFSSPCDAGDRLRPSTCSLRSSRVTVARTAAKVPEALQLGPNLVKDKALGVVITGKI